MNIPFLSLKLIKNFPKPLLFIFTFLLLQSAHASDYLISPNGKKIIITKAETLKEQVRGLSGVKSNEFSDMQGMLFIYENEGIKNFWMPDTYFNLDIFFMDKNLKVVGIDRNAPAHPGKQEPPSIYRVKPYRAKYVLEVKANSPTVLGVKEGDVFKLESNLEKESSTRLLK